MKITPEKVANRLSHIIPANKEVEITATLNKKKVLKYYINGNRVFFIKNYLVNYLKNIFVKSNDKNCMSLSFNVIKKPNNMKTENEHPPKLSELVKGLREPHVTMFKDAQKWIKVDAYTSFIEQQLNPSMFIPCKLVNGKFEVLNEPKDPCQNNTYCIDFCQGRCREDDYNEELEEYQTALSNVLFEGWKYRGYDDEYNLFKVYNGFTIFFLDVNSAFNEDKYYYTIEDILHLVTLTPKGKEIAGLI